MLITIQGAHCLQSLMTPPRGIYAVGIVLIEYRLIIKGQKEEEDQVLIDGYSMYAPSFYADFQKLIWHINTGHFGTIYLTIFAIPKAVLVDLEFEVCQIEDNHEHDSLAIVATYFNINTSFIIFNGKLGVGKLPPLTLSARHDKHFSIKVYKYYNIRVAIPMVLSGTVDSVQNIILRIFYVKACLLHLKNMERVQKYCPVIWTAFRWL